MTVFRYSLTDECYVRCEAIVGLTEEETSHVSVKSLSESPKLAFLATWLVCERSRGVPAFRDELFRSIVCVSFLKRTLLLWEFGA